MSWRSRGSRWLLPLCMAFLANQPLGNLPLETARSEVFPLTELSVLEPGPNAESFPRDFLRGQGAETSEQPAPEVTVYPKFESAQPVYGSVRFAVELDDPGSGVRHHFVVDESRGTGQGYDRLHFDRNRDLDLANDKALERLKNPPAASSGYSGVKTEVFFDPLELEFGGGSGASVPLELLPRLTVFESGMKLVAFVCTKVWTGKVQIRGKAFGVVLGQDYYIGGRFNHPITALGLTPTGDNDWMQPQWWEGDRLMAMHRFGNQYYRFSASPRGDRLTVAPYAGALGLFQVGAGGRKLEPLSASGSLQSRDCAVAVGGSIEHGWPTAIDRCRLPVGDYLPSYLTVRMGRYSVNLSQNYHADGKPRDRGDRPFVYGIPIRSDTPFVLDFSNRPEILFASPAQGARFKPGDKITVDAVLVDPKLDIMIRGLTDTTRTQKHEFVDGAGQKQAYDQPLSLDPHVIIRRANGDQVAEGVMPFG